MISEFMNYDRKFYMYLVCQLLQDFNCTISAADVGSLVRLITANDRDRNPTLLYDFTASGNPGNTFAIDRFSGRITLAKPLDHEVRKRYALGLTVCFHFQVISFTFYGIIDINVKKNWCRNFNQFNFLP